MNISNLLPITLTIELIVLFLCVSAIILQRVINTAHNKRQTILKQKISDKIIQFIEGQQVFNANQKYPEFLDEELLLNVLEAFNLRFKDDNWDFLKDSISKVYLLPKARSRSLSPFWVKRNFAARAFTLTPIPEDENLICKLLDDKVFLVRNCASYALVELESEVGIHKILKKMDEEPGFARYIYKDAILQGKGGVFTLIEKIANQDQNDAIHRSALDILSEKKMTLVLSFLESDTYHQNTEIKRAAIRIYARNPQRTSEKILLKHIRDQDSEIREEAALGLANFPSNQAYDELFRALKDKSVNVRIQAARSLKLMGRQGIDLLKRIEMRDDPTYSIVQYALTFS